MSYDAIEQSKQAETSPLTDVYARITAKIIMDMEQGNLTWRKPWNSEHLAGFVTRPLRWNNIPYTGINTIVLWATAAEKGYIQPHWMTFKQAVDLKGAVCKGEKGTQIVYADNIVKQKEDDNGQEQTYKIPYLKTYTVFNASQIEGLPDHYYQKPEPKQSNDQERIAELEEFFARTKADIYTATQASYSQATDRIQMPPFESFATVLDFYATLAHETVHWTKHPKRLDRDFGRKRFGDEGYAKEELTAELGACFLAADLGFAPRSQEQSAAYIQSWLKALNEDKRLIFTAASHAQKAVEYLHQLVL